MKIHFLYVFVIAFSNNAFAQLSLVETENSGFDAQGHELYQGDMILDEQQRKFVENPEETRKAFNNELYRWPNATVQYRLDPSSFKARAAIQRGIKHWEENSCIQFEEVTPDYKQPHIIFYNFGGCFSSVGRLYYQPEGQIISIGCGCESLGTVAHEIGHSLGFYHEQSRPDRDNYVVLLKENVHKSMIHNFNLETKVNDYNVTYDLGSVMHYGPDGFSKNGRNTLVTKDPFKHFVIGQRQKLSFADIKLGNLMYKCADQCKSKPNCANDGFVDQHCQCVCPPGFSGPICEEQSQAEDLGVTCGGTIDRPMTIQSPNYPCHYPKNTQCVWVATAPTGHKVRVTFGNFQLNNRSIDKNWCTWDYLELRDENLQDGQKFCGTELQGTIKTSQSNTMVLLFATATDFYCGFKAWIDFI